MEEHAEVEGEGEREGEGETRERARCGNCGKSAALLRCIFVHLIVCM